MLEIQYTGLSFNTPANVRFRYRLDGFDRTWTEAGMRRVAYYTNLPPGRYNFRVMACNSDGVWTSSDTVLHFYIEPFFFQTLWFLALSVVGVIGAGYGLYRLRLRQLRRQKRRLERTVAERTQEIRDQNTEILHQQKMLEEQARDIEISNSELSERNAQLAQVNTLLQELHSRKNEVIGVVAHDLKNPVSSIILTSSSLERYGEKIPTEQIRSSVQRIRSTAERMNKIITDLLDIDALDSGQLRLALDYINVVAVLRQAVEDFSTQAQDKNITIHFQPSVDVSFVIADIRALRQIFDNLISNALKYSQPNTHVWVRLVADMDSSSPRYTVNGKLSRPPLHIVRVSIQDEGPGISADELSLLFQRFAKLTPKPTAGEDSTGLGLYIVKQFVEEIEGVVYCRSVVGEGSTFVVEFPTVDDAEVAEHALREEVLV
jgi:signal transduction histidine kinase